MDRADPNLPDRKGRWIATGVVWIAVCGVVQAGSLEPPGPPAPTMKTLDQVEARTPISAADIPLVIATEGSYYLTENVFATAFGQTAITVDAEDVVIDLNGFMISDSQVGQFDENIAGGAGVTVKNGIVARAIGRGVWLGADARVVGVTAIANGSHGIQVGDRSVVLDSVARDNSGTGIDVEGSGTVSRCLAEANTHGIEMDGGSVIDSVADGNTAHGFNVTSTNVVDCAAEGNGAAGVRGVSSRVSGCLVVGNDVGIHVRFGAQAIGNTCRNNATDGILVPSDADTILDGNHVSGSQTGIRVVSTGNFVFRNTANNNTTHFSVPNGNKAANISTTPATAGPWDNIRF